MQSSAINHTEKIMVNTSGVVLGSGQSQIVSAGDTATGTTVKSGGEQIVSSGGIAIDTTVQSIGQINVEGGTVSRLTIESGGAFGGNAGATVTNAINLNRTDGNSAFSIENGIASNVLIECGAVFYVESVQTAVNTLVALGGCLCVFCGGTVTNTTVKSGGQISFDKGSTVSGLTIESGGRFEEYDEFEEEL